MRTRLDRRGTGGQRAWAVVVGGATGSACMRLLRGTELPYVASAAVSLVVLVVISLALLYRLPAHGSRDSGQTEDSMDKSGTGGTDPRTAGMLFGVGLLGFLVLAAVTQVWWFLALAALPAAGLVWATRQRT